MTLLGRDERRHAGSGMRVLLLAAITLLVPMMSIGADPLPVELTPQRIVLAWQFDGSAEFSPEFQQRLRAQVAQAIERTVGERWRIEHDPSNTVACHDLAILTPRLVPVARSASIPPAAHGLPSDEAPDKWLFITISGDGARYVAASREWDRITDSLGPLRSAEAVDRGDLPGAILAALLAASRPVGQIAAAHENSATLSIRGAGIPPRDPAIAIAPGTIFTVVLRKRDRDGPLVEIKPIPHTYLEATDGSVRGLTTIVRSALRQPLAGRRGRVEAWAIAAPAGNSSTRFAIARRGDDLPLSGRIVEIRTSPPRPGQDESLPTRSLLTDRAGAVTIPVDPQQPLLWLTVKSSEATLMRLPLAAGVEPEVTLSLGDDQRRLDAESRIAIVTGELIETVAKRATLMAQARSNGRKGQYEVADAALADADRLPDVAAFRRRLAAIETPAAEAADQAGDRLAAARIRALGRKTVGLVERYLNPETLRTTREEVEELKRTDPDRR